MELVNLAIIVIALTVLIFSSFRSMANSATGNQTYTFGVGFVVAFWWMTAMSVGIIVMLVTTPIFGEDTASALGRWATKETTVRFYIDNVHYWLSAGAAISASPYIARWVLKRCQYA